jgi:hypothetical protein
MFLVIALIKSWNWDLIISISSIILQAASLVAIVILLIERSEKKRPYLQVAYEVLRGSLVCIVINNVGDVAARVNSFKCNDDFCTQLPEKVQNHFKGLLNTDFVVVPNQKWVLSLNINSFDIINEFKQKEATFIIRYSRLDGKKKCTEKATVNFSSYGGFLIYQSEMDEMRKEVKKVEECLTKLVKKVTDKKNIIFCDEIKIIPCSTFEDGWENYIAGDRVDNSDEPSASKGTGPQVDE